MKWTVSIWIASAALLAALALQASPWNASVFMIVNTWGAQWSAVLWSCLTILGDTWVVLALLAIGLWWQPQALLAFALAVPLAGAISRLTKVISQVPRPAGALDPGSFHIIGPVLEFHAFPSGHTLSAFALVGVLWAGRQIRWFGWWALGVAAGVGLSRIAVGAHWPADVVAGAALGWMCGSLTQAWGKLWLSRQSQAHQDRNLRWLAWACLVLCAWTFQVDTHYPLAQPLQVTLAAIGVLSCAWWLWRTKQSPNR
ncbi:MAG: phosphatase PAP2 family protein [Betaproteobacteria bacterium]|nr:phosphatase PAP2 family protein [Betaproteobacteria bacterium]NBY04453.1 phosphatase PAP2 family protein [Betaproteobacteria bacterium]